jgi:cytochrome c553
MSRLVATAVVLALLAASPVLAQSHDPAVGSGNLGSPYAAVELSPAARRGLIYVKANCAECHAIEQVGASSMASAPPLRDLNIRYPVADLQRPLSEGIHPKMPRMQLTAGQLMDVIAYLKTLRLR